MTERTEAAEQDGYAKVPVELPEVRILRLEPGDVLLLTTPYRISDADFEYIRDRFAEQMPGHRMALLENGMTLDILRKGGD